MILHFFVKNRNEVTKIAYLCICIMETNSYIKQFPDIMKGKKVMYVHGFGSSAQSGTVKRIQEMLPNATVVAEDIPLHPEEGIAMLKAMVAREKPDLIIGTSMGGMYTEMLYGFDRILINPAFEIADTMGAHGLTGKQVFQNPRKDGVQEFLVTKGIVKEYREMQEQCFKGLDEMTDEEKEKERSRVWALFGDKDELVDTYDLYMQHYCQGISFHGEHRTNDKVFHDSVMPLIRWIDDKQEGRERPIVYITMDALRDQRGMQRSSAMKAFRFLLESYQVFIVAEAPDHDLTATQDIYSWVQEIVNVPAYQHLVFTHRKDLLYGDYLIDASTSNRSEDFMGTRIAFGSETFKTWEEIITFFERIGGQ